MELLDLWCGCLSWRTLAQHVRWLPADSALHRSVRDSVRLPSDAEPLSGDSLTRAVLQSEWSPERWSLHRIEYLLEQIIWQNNRNADAPLPTPGPAPGDEVGAAVDVSGRDIPAWGSVEAQQALAWMYAQPTS